MILTQEQRNVVANKINQLWTESKKCSVCGNEKWNLQDKLFSSPQFGSVTNETERQHYPVVVLTCSTCVRWKFSPAVRISTMGSDPNFSNN